MTVGVLVRVVGYSIQGVAIRYIITHKLRATNGGALYVQLH